jgi:hypothetical protein
VYTSKLLYSLTHGTEPFLRSRQLCSYSRTSQHFIEPAGSLPCSQEPSTSPYPEPDQSNSYHPILCRVLYYHQYPYSLVSDIWPCSYINEVQMVGKQHSKRKWHTRMCKPFEIIHRVLKCRRSRSLLTCRGSVGEPVHRSRGYETDIIVPATWWSCCVTETGAGRRMP